MPQVPARPGPDGVVRPVKEEERLNSLFHALFKSPAGADVLNHLRRITIETAGGPLISNDELRHREGQRFLVYLIQARINLAENPPNEHDSATKRTTRRVRPERSELYDDPEPDL
jgi:hypothetical protein